MIAARLDGELVSIGLCFGSVDEVVAPAHRGSSLAAVLPSRLIAERMTAAWVLGAVSEQPTTHQLCADAAARYRLVGRPDLVVREVAMDESDVEVHGGMRVTTPFRTAIDLARIGDETLDTELGAVRMLAGIGGFALDHALDQLDRRRHLPNKARAVARLTEALSG